MKRTRLYYELYSGDVLNRITFKEFRTKRKAVAALWNTPPGSVVFQILKTKRANLTLAGIDHPLSKVKLMGKFL